MNSPTLIIIHGLPATGKTTLGQAIADKLLYPFLSRDAFKERLFDSMNIENPDVAWSGRLGAASFEMTYLAIEQLLSARISCISETCWTPKFAEPVFSKMITNYQPNIIQIFVKSDSNTRAERYKTRAKTNRHQAHMDLDRLKIQDNNSPGTSPINSPLNLPGLLIEIDTTDFSVVDIDEIVERISIC